MLNGTVLGNAIFNAIKSIEGSIPTNEPITDEKRKEIWIAVATEIVSHIQSNGQVISNGATGVGTPGGPLPILNLPGIIS